MPKHKKRKNAGQEDHASGEREVSETTHNPDTFPEPIHLPNAATLLDEVQQRCESLRDWQRNAQASLQERSQVIERREKELDETQKLVELGRSRLELDQDAIKRARLMLDKERAQVEQSQQSIEAEQARLERARCELNDQKQELQGLREEMDTEWASLARIRRAQESLAAALDCERTRMQEVQLAGSLGNVEAASDEPVTDDTPGLSLTQAA